MIDMMTNELNYAQHHLGVVDQATLQQPRYIIQ